MVHIKRIDEMLGVGAEGRKALEDLYLGKKIRITHLNGEDSSYVGREGVVKSVDDIGQLHGTWGGLAVIPDEDAFEVVGVNESSEYTVDDFRREIDTTGAPEELVQYVIDNVPDFDHRYEEAMYNIGRTRRPFRDVDNSLYDDICDAVEEWCDENGSDADDYNVEEIFG